MCVIEPEVICTALGIWTFDRNGLVMTKVTASEAAMFINLNHAAVRHKSVHFFKD